MSKLTRYAKYPPRSLLAAEAALLTVWISSARYHEDLVLTGGLALKYLTVPAQGLVQGVIAMDLEFATRQTLAVGQGLAEGLAAHGFRSEEGRISRLFETMLVVVNFVTEHPVITQGSFVVNDLPAIVIPGAARAFATRRRIAIQGKDLYGRSQKPQQIWVTGIGPFLILKLNAFANRREPKDAYDILVAIGRYANGPEAAALAFWAEAMAGNRGFERADATLRQQFIEPTCAGATSCAAFALEGRREDTQANRRQVAMETAAAARLLLGYR